jgi:hypothetical protein
MIVIVVGSHLFGLWGVILGPLLVAAARDVIKYFIDQWNRPPLSSVPLEDIEVADEPAPVVESPDQRRGAPEE